MNRKWRKEIESKKNGQIINGKNKEIFWKKRKRRSRKDKKEIILK